MMFPVEFSSFCAGIRSSQWPIHSLFDDCCDLAPEDRFAANKKRFRHAEGSKQEYLSKEKHNMNGFMVVVGETNSKT
jgi:hypothetical protein